MKVLDLRCAHDHRFEGWFASEEEAQSQISRDLVQCPVCGDHAVTRLPSAPRLNLSGATAREGKARPAAPAAAPVTLQALYMKAVKQVLAQTEDVGDRFAEEARRMHYDEAPERGIRGSASPEEVQALAEEGIETFPLVVPDALKQTAH
ncbi:conserved hypothetical protein, DUF1178 [Cupriavidus taiwanensis]|uniref:DUF1178 family protein n=1 Tax=Cupriavidus taiwanensis TaxID=164546 RepID=UPI000E1222C4|nr:DUF1178 family protein [Cupriavidus taiwanensis]SOZ15705.1 conserved hypothetical protein, DUF1178 [Cupriavidus taiwanensis]SOZ28816.1 conserved hypothetical protein, DUF1178 [Cupriavidus taiwanensis]SOZ46277.1 conserved hypothetical protein, DUF1178 [Cupriavidus taiwanensis]SPA00260.1 conserved hypothetical protein, DUF1178 [Cupriavidus taiwanensis]SPA14396.1 conserved hypothetical protein, DUF1178 [Cupriavidus taiwanensis]